MKVFIFNIKFVEIYEHGKIFNNWHEKIFYHHHHHHYYYYYNKSSIYQKKKNGLIILLHYYSQVPIIAVPRHPIAAVVRGSLEYGLYMDVIQTRVLKFCYGVEVSARWERSDPLERKTPSGCIFKFHKLALHGTEVAVNQKLSYILQSLAIK